MQTEDLKIVLKVAELRSITAAATDLDLLPATASAAIKRVEAALGIELFIRTTRSLRLSSAGERYIPQCKEALQMLDQAQQKLKQQLDIIDGELRIAVSSDLGRNLVVPWLDAFMEDWPKLRLKLNISDSAVDFYRDPVDIALRYGSPQDANLYGFKICDVPGVLCASPAYLAQHGIPEHPADLAGHNGLFCQVNDLVHDHWSFTNGDEVYRIKMKGDRAANDGDLVRRWCVTGKGVAVKSALDMAADLLAGNVVPLLPAYRPKASELWMICPSRQMISPAARLLRDALRQKCSAILRELARMGLIMPTDHAAEPPALPGKNG